VVYLFIYSGYFYSTSLS